jgi:uncharacterized protein
MTKEGRGKQGFASMDPKRRAETARRGGAAVPADKRAFAQDRDLAVRAGRLGGLARRGTKDAEK